MHTHTQKNKKRKETLKGWEYLRHNEKKSALGQSPPLRATKCNRIRLHLRLYIYSQQLHSHGACGAICMEKKCGKSTPYQRLYKMNVLCSVHTHTDTHITQPMIIYWFISFGIVLKARRRWWSAFSSQQYCPVPHNTVEWPHNSIVIGFANEFTI